MRADRPTKRRKDNVTIEVWVLFTSYIHVATIVLLVSLPPQNHLLIDNLGSSERLLSSPVPLFYSRHTARFLGFWLLLLPLALYEPLANSWNHLSMIPVTFFLSLFLFGIEELATQLEEPFTLLPMQAYSERIGNWCNEIVSFEPGDNGIEAQNVPGTPYPTGYEKPTEDKVPAVVTNVIVEDVQTSEPASNSKGRSRLRSLIGKLSKTQ